MRGASTPRRAITLCCAATVVASTMTMAFPLAASLSNQGLLKSVASHLVPGGHLSRVAASTLTGSMVGAGAVYVTPSTGWAVGSHEDSSGNYTPLVDVTTDGGASWTQQAVPSGAHCLQRAAFTDTSHGWIVGNQNACAGDPYLLSTTDGVTWSYSSLPISGDDPASGISFVDDLHGWITGATFLPFGPPYYAGWILRTTDGGVTWSQQSVPSGVGLVSTVTMINQTVGWAVGYQSYSAGNVPQLLRTTDGGATWIQAQLPSDFTAGTLDGVSASDPSHVWAVGWDSGSVGRIIASSDGGVTWSDEAVPACFTPNSTLASITSIDANHSFVAGQANCGSRGAEEPIILGTNNGGSTWTIDYGATTGLGYRFTSVSFADATHGLAISDQAQAITSANGGLSWTATPAPISGPPLTGPSNSELWGSANPGETGGAFPLEGDGVNPINGNVVQNAVDLTLPGRGRALSFGRTYNSLDAAGETTGLTDPLGYGWTDVYNLSLAIDPSNTYFTVHQENGTTVTFTLVNGSFTAPARVNATLSANSSGYLYTLANQRADQFDSSGKLLSETDRNGYITSLTRNGAGQVVSITDPSNRSLSLTYTGTGQVLTVSDSYGRTATYGYDANFNLAQVTDVNSNVTTYTYDSSHRLTSVRDAAGTTVLSSVTYATDGSSRVVAETDNSSSPRTVTFSYGAGTTTVAHPMGDNTVYNYATGEPTTVTYGANSTTPATWRFGYDPNDNQTAVTDPRGNSTAQTFDAKGNLLSSTDPLGRTTTYTYTQRNDRQTAKDPAGNTTTYSYDANGNLTQVARTLTSTSQTVAVALTYGDTAHPGDVTARTDEDGFVWHYARDGDGNPASGTDPLGHEVTTSYDGRGFLLARVSGAGNVSGGNPASYTTSYTYDNAGHVLTATDPLGHQTITSYDGDGHPVRVQDPDGHVTQYGYDAANELTSVTRHDLSTLHNAYDSDGRLWQQYDSTSALTQYDHDALGRVVLVTDPLGRTTSYAYDGNGNLTQRVDASSRTTTFTYDADNELGGITYSDNVTPNASFTYDADGRRVAMSDGSGQSTYSYDSLGRLTQQTNGANSTVGYGYNLRGLVTTLTYPAGKAVTRQYDGAGELQWIKDWVLHQTNFGYDADNNLTSITYPSGLVTSLSVDTADRVMAMTTKSSGGSTTASLSYTRDSANLVSSSQATGVPGNSEAYSYTGLDQVGALNGAAFGYDGADNLTTMVGKASTGLTYGSANQLNSLTQSGATTNFTFDPEGERVKATTGSSSTAMGFDQAGRLTSYSTTTTYRYDGDGLRMAKTTGHTQEPYTWDTAEGTPHLLVDNGVSYVYGPAGLPLEQISGSKNVTYYFHADQVGSTRALSDASGNLVATYAYDPYGRLTASTGTVTNPFQFAGGYTDSESGFQYLQARYYDPNTGQFLTRDPATATSRSPYGYVHGDPLNASDPTGLLDLPFGLCLRNPFGGQNGNGGCQTALSTVGAASGLEQAFNTASIILTAGAAGLPELVENALTRGLSLGAADTAASVGAREAAVGVTQPGETFVRVGASPENLNWTFDGAGGTRAGTYAFPQDTIEEIGNDPAALKNFGDLPGEPPSVFRILEPPTGTPIQRGIVPGGEFGGVGGVPEVYFPEGW